MSKEECQRCEYEERCFYLLKAKQRLSKEPCGQFRKKKEPKPAKPPQSDKELIHKAEEVLKK